MKKSCFIILGWLVTLANPVFSQTGITVSPPRTYYTGELGKSSSNKILVTNPSKTQPLELTITLNDWEYDKNGSNVIKDPGTLKTTMADWISIQPQSFLTLAPGETQEVELIVTPPTTDDAKDVPVHTALVYFTQTNPVDSFNDKGALVKVSVRTGVKVYHSQPKVMNADIDFYDFTYLKNEKKLKLGLINQGNIWTDGTIVTDLVRQDDGSTIKLDDLIVYTLPDDKREIIITLPQNLKPGKYIASSTFTHEGDGDLIKVAELTFTHE